jgi:UV radiation resistance-associated gene protein
LVETFIAVAVCLPESMSVEDVSKPSPMSANPRPPTNPRSSTFQTFPSSSQQVASKPNGSLKKPSSATSPNKRRLVPADTSAKFSALKPAPMKQDSRKLNGISQSHSSSRKGNSRVDLALESDASPEIGLSPPAYFSPIHRPSTNPLFPIDTCLNQAHWPDTSGQNLKVEVWGKMPIQIEHPARLDESERLTEDQTFNWKLLDEWDVNLDRLAPLPNDVQTIFPLCLLTDW